MNESTFREELAFLRAMLDLLEQEPGDALYALTVEQAAKSVVFCARELAKSKEAAL